MVTREFTYTDYNGNERTEEHCFNLTRAELTKMEMSTDGGFASLIDRVVKAQDGRQIMDIFEDILRRSHGVKSPDGRRLIKSPELFEEFSQTPAYDELFMELVLDADKASKFVNAIVPPNPSNASSIPAPKE